MWCRPNQRTRRRQTAAAAGLGVAAGFSLPWFRIPFPPSPWAAPGPAEQGAGSSPEGCGVRSTQQRPARSRRPVSPGVPLSCRPHPDAPTSRGPEAAPPLGLRPSSQTIKHTKGTRGIL